MRHPNRANIDCLCGTRAVERRKQRCRRGAIKATIVKKDF
jgi:hypothetical protein